jgi:DNA-binding Xre family transcriptional regulator
VVGVIKIILRPDIDVNKMLKDKGYSSYRIQRAKEKTGRYVLGQSTLTKLRKHQRPSYGELERICSLLHVYPSDLLAVQFDNGVVKDFSGNVISDPNKKAPPASTRVYDDDGEEVMPDFLRY